MSAKKKLKVVSCTNCSKIFECNIRKSYIKAVYQSMNKGHGGGFEF
jgi:transcription elongation factor Elf1